MQSGLKEEGWQAAVAYIVRSKQYGFLVSFQQVFPATAPNTLNVQRCVKTSGPEEIHVAASTHLKIRHLVDDII